MQKIFRTQRIIYNFKWSERLNKITFIKSFLTGVLHDRFKLIYTYLNEGDKIRECYSCLKMIMQSYSHLGFFTFFIKRASLT